MRPPLTKTLFVSAYSIQHSRYRTPYDQHERGKRDNPAERPMTNVPNHVRSRVLYKLQAQEYYKKLQLQVQFTRIYTIHH